jgi:hypothetical protein
MLHQLSATLAGIGGQMPAQVPALIGIVASAAVALVLIVAVTVNSVMKGKHREESRREIAAYVAEGSMSTADATALLAAGNDELRKRIANGVAWGTIRPKDAERLMGAAAGEAKVRA